MRNLWNDRSQKRDHLLELRRQMDGRKNRKVRLIEKGSTGLFFSPFLPSAIRRLGDAKDGEAHML